MAGRQDVQNFVRDALINGKSRSDIQAALQSAGWAPSEIDDALTAWAESDFVPPVPRPQSVVTARDFFIYALTFGALLFAAIYMVQLMQFLVDTLFEDNLRVYRTSQARWAMAMVIVAAPIYAWLTWRERQKLAQDPSLYRSSIRKWMTYLALLGAAATLLGDLAYVVYSFLDGEFTLQFLLKALGVAVVAGGIFLFYLSDIRKGDQA